MQNLDFSADQSIKEKEEDKFSRWDFANQIANVIINRKDENNLAIGINGKWGEGKTSVLNFIRKIVSTHKNIVTVEFNPWRIENEKSLLNSFFITLSKALDKDLMTGTEKLADTVNKSSAILDMLPIPKGINELLSAFIPQPDLEELKNRIERELSNQSKKVLILIDDIDRLDEKEIYYLFRMIKLTADFKYTTYLLAFDKKVVASSLAKRFPDGGENFGNSFLEKIIQLPLNLPIIQQIDTNNFLFEKINRILEINEIDISDEKANEFLSIYNLAFDKFFSTPRMGNLYSNILNFSIPILKDEVNIVDLMIIEAIRVISPTLYKSIGKNKEMFVGRFFSLEYGQQNNSENESIKNLIEIALVKDGIENKDDYISALQKIFPKLQSVYGNNNYGHEWSKIWDEGQRICSLKYFQRYFSLTIPENDISDQIIDALVHKLSATDLVVSPTNNPLNKLINPKNSLIIIKKLNIKIRNMDSFSQKNLAKSLTLVMDIFPYNKNSLGWDSTFSQAVILVKEIIFGLENNLRDEQACELIALSGNINFITELYRWINAENNNEKRKDKLSKSQLEKINSCSKEYFLPIFEDYIDITTNEIYFPQLLLFVASVIFDKKIIESYIIEKSKTDNEFLSRFIDIYVPTSHEVGSGKTRKSDLSLDHLRQITSIVNKEELTKLIGEKIDITSISQTEFPSSYQNDDKDIYLKQVIYLIEMETKKMQDKKT